MTAVAWDGTTLAADKRATNCGIVFTVTKVFRVGDRLVGFSGSAAQIGRYLAWMRDGFDPKTYPAQEKDDTCYALCVHSSGLVERYEWTGYPVVVEEKQHAMGSGRDFALAAMHLRCDARQAVAVAALFCCDVGNGVDALTFDVVERSLKLEPPLPSLNGDRVTAGHVGGR